MLKTMTEERAHGSPLKAVQKHGQAGCLAILSGGKAQIMVL